ncbi:S-adenosyl-L-methionine-dependent methyltransferase [Thelephora ganbajun]|uniref:S-adenosyl-L-methionine-dependent methyltransferase n=1 Tax=Thelephora ganbajun TaxID=370292 RepID=A0ACB6ZM24_THEGA|nr:S-adenosyl-L-methionine-dependent methyltransferase [Thelephora ganbajun]
MSAKAVDAWLASEYNEAASFVYSTENTAPVLALLDPKSGDKIIDFGCGSGEVTIKLSKVVADVGIVVGVDSSQSMASTTAPSTELEKAKKNGLENVFVQDIQALDDEFASRLLIKHGQFDKVFSNAVLHWCKLDPAGVIRSVKKVLKPGGVFVAEFGGWGNCIGVRSALHSALRKRGYDPIARDPWYFPSTESYSKLLVSEGFEVVNISLVPRQTLLAGHILEWLRLFTKRTTFFQGIDLNETEVILGEVANTCEVDAKDTDNDRWMLMYVRLRVLARRTTEDLSINDK